jgi:glycosyltransferase involved in cell wall biosynthesis
MRRVPADPVRILRVIARLNIGGPALHVSYLTKDLEKRGYTSTLVAGRVGKGEGSMEYIAADLGIEPVYIHELQREISAASDVIATARIRKLIHDLRPDIVHTHTAKAGAVGRMAALSMRGGCRPILVHTFHGHVLRGYFRGPAEATFTSLERVLARHTDALIAVSPQVRDDLVSLGVAPAERTSVIRLGLDLDARLHSDPDARLRVRKELGVGPEQILIGWLGRMTEIKRVDDLLRSFADLRARGVNAVLALVGDGPLLSQLEVLAERLGIGNSCRFVGFSADVGRFLAAFDVVALTSANEGTPVTLIEAQAAGIPVVATDVGGTSDVVAHGETGLLTPPGNPTAFADGLERLAADASLRRELGAAGRQRVKGRYARERLADDIDRLYRSLLAERAAGRVRTRAPSLTESLPRTLGVSAPSVVSRRTPRHLRVILLSQYFPPEIGATQSRMQSFAEHLADRGHEVTVICELPNHPHGKIPPVYDGIYFEDDRSNPYRVLRVRVLAHREKTQLTRMQFYLSYMAMAVAAAPKAGKADVVVATSPPLSTGVAGVPIARMNRAPLVLDVRDLWPAAAVSLDQIGSKLGARASGSVEGWLYRQATATTAVTRPFCQHIDRFRSTGLRTAFIPNGTLDMFFDAEPDGDRSSLGSRDQFVVTFAGTHGIAQGLPSVLDAAALVADSVEFVLIGDGPVRDLLISSAATRGISNVRFLPQVPLEKTPPLLAASDALLVPLSKHETFRTFVPSKLIDFMAVGRPVILSAAGEAEDIVERAGSGIVVAPEDPRALADGISWLQAHPDDAQQMGERGRVFARKRLRSRQAERLEELLIDVVDRDRRPD